MSDANAGDYVARDISPVTEGDGWRWTYQRPQLRFYLLSTENWKFTTEFAIPARIFRETGPLTLSYSINGHPLDTVRYDQPGHCSFVRPVPPEWLQGDGINLVSIQPDKVWISKGDGARLGFVLANAGFIH